MAQLEPWFAASKLPFFPEYTDHGPIHIENVLLTAASLMRDGIDDILTANDIAVLVFAILLHDSGMHLTEDAFLALIDPRRPHNRIESFDATPWTTLWDEFLLEARHWSDRQLLDLFGDTNPIHRPSADPIDYTLRDRMLIGEFLRRHHPRIAHEIALHGVPSLGLEPIQITLDSQELRDISGLIARSHGIPIRSSFQHLIDNYDLRQYYGIHSVFLMCLLRIADYLQLEAERAPAAMLRIARMRSPKSQKEWDAHRAIKDLSHSHDDPEAIQVTAFPQTVTLFHRIRYWLDDIQHELDVSWAALGEVYGYRPELDKLGLVIRRVKSNIDDLSRFSTKVTYIPRRFRFQADADLMKLLVEPLYHDDPSIGARELIQNSVDAVRARKASAFSADFPEDPTAPDVTVSVTRIDADDAIFEIKDRGIGMTPDVIQDYFLTAGASFRKSPTFLASLCDNTGESKYLRSGRFGIGVLAAFLIGDQIEVTTRYAGSSSDSGITFSAGIDTEFIELKRCSCDVGTIIRIRSKISRLFEGPRLRSSYFAPANYDWYCLEWPVGSPGTELEFAL